MSVIVENITKLYGTQKAVDDISFDVKKGEIVGFLGPNGAGKSTTMKVISCYTLPTSGKVTVNGFDIFENPLKVKECVGYLPEQNPLYDDMYIMEYLLFIARLHKIKGNHHSKVEEMIKITGLGPERHKKIGKLSKGFRQRVGLAQTLIHNPEVLLLDEPTSGLDPNQIVEIRNLIIEIGKTKTIILSSHIMQEVEAMCNRVIIINKGKIVADDSVDKLINRNQSRFLLTVEFKLPVEKTQLLKVNGIEKAELIGHKWQLVCKTIDSRELLFNFAVEKGNKILEMKTIEDSLETVFHQLTSDIN